MRRAAFVLPLLMLCSTATAVVIRHDVEDAQYRLAPGAVPALVDLPGEGHGVLVAPHWVLTAAHAVSWQDCIETVVIGGIERAVERVVLHPDYRSLPQAVIDEALRSRSSAPVTALLLTTDDIALLRLAQPVTDVAPLALHGADATVGQRVRIVGQGATGDGVSGHAPDGPNRTQLREAFNRLSAADGRWLTYVFDAPPHAITREGIAGNGDSGGPLLVEADGEWQVVGLTSWKAADDDPATFRPGLYGQVNKAVRIAHYRAWIDTTLAPDAAR